MDHLFSHRNLYDGGLLFNVINKINSVQVLNAIVSKGAKVDDVDRYG